MHGVRFGFRFTNPKYEDEKHDQEKDGRRKEEYEIIEGYRVYHDVIRFQIASARSAPPAARGNISPEWR